MYATLQNEVGKGAFQELDQVRAVEQFCKFAGQAKSASDIVPTITAALKVSLVWPAWSVHYSSVHMIQFATESKKIEHVLNRLVSSKFFVRDLGLPLHCLF